MYQNKKLFRLFLFVGVLIVHASSFPLSFSFLFETDTSTISDDVENNGILVHPKEQSQEQEEDLPLEEEQLQQLDTKLDNTNYIKKEKSTTPPPPPPQLPTTITPTTSSVDPTKTIFNENRKLARVLKSRHTRTKTRNEKSATLSKNFPSYQKSSSSSSSRNSSSIKSRSRFRSRRRRRRNGTRGRSGSTSNTMKVILSGGSFSMLSPTPSPKADVVFTTTSASSMLTSSSSSSSFASSSASSSHNEEEGNGEAMLHIPNKARTISKSKKMKKIKKTEAYYNQYNYYNYYNYSYTSNDCHSDNYGSMDTSSPTPSSTSTATPTYHVYSSKDAKGKKCRSKKEKISKSKKNKSSKKDKKAKYTRTPTVFPTFVSLNPTITTGGGGGDGGGNGGGGNVTSTVLDSPIFRIDLQFEDANTDFDPKKEFYNITSRYLTNSLLNAASMNNWTIQNVTLIILDINDILTNNETLGFVNGRKLQQVITMKAIFMKARIRFPTSSSSTSSLSVPNVRSITNVIQESFTDPESADTYVSLLREGSDTTLSSITDLNFTLEETLPPSTSPTILPTLLPTTYSFGASAFPTNTPHPSLEFVGVTLSPTQYSFSNTPSVATLPSSESPFTTEFPTTYSEVNTSIFPSISPPPTIRNFSTTNSPSTFSFAHTSNSPSNSHHPTFLTFPTTVSSSDFRMKLAPNIQNFNADGDFFTLTSLHLNRIFAEELRPWSSYSHTTLVIIDQDADLDSENDTQRGRRKLQQFNFSQSVIMQVIVSFRSSKVPTVREIDDLFFLSIVGPETKGIYISLLRSSFDSNLSNVEAVMFGKVTPGEGGAMSNSPTMTPTKTSHVHSDEPTIELPSLDSLVFRLLVELDLGDGMSALDVFGDFYVRTSTFLKQYLLDELIIWPIQNVILSIIDSNENDDIRPEDGKGDMIQAVQMQIRLILSQDLDESSNDFLKSTLDSAIIRAFTVDESLDIYINFLRGSSDLLLTTTRNVEIEVSEGGGIESSPSQSPSKVFGNFTQQPSFLFTPIPSGTTNTSTSSLQPSVSPSISSMTNSSSLPSLSITNSPTFSNQTSIQPSINNNTTLQPSSILSLQPSSLPTNASQPVNTNITTNSSIPTNRSSTNDTFILPLLFLSLEPTISPTIANDQSNTNTTTNSSIPTNQTSTNNTIIQPPSISSLEPTKSPTKSTDQSNTNTTTNSLLPTNQPSTNNTFLQPPSISSLEPTISPTKSTEQSNTNTTTNSSMPTNQLSTNNTFLQPPSISLLEPTKSPTIAIEQSTTNSSIPTNHTSANNTFLQPIVIPTLAPNFNGST